MGNFFQKEEPPMVIQYGYPFNPPGSAKPQSKTKTRSKSIKSFEYAQPIGPENIVVPAGFDPYERRHALPPRFAPPPVKKGSTKRSRTKSSTKSANTPASKKLSRMGSFHASREPSARVAKSQSLFREDYNPFEP
jgi:hypothetical protein